jgi:hypothetical protein
VKLTVNKPVFWNVGEKKMSGKVKQVMGDHIVVKAADAEYIVNKSCLSTTPVSKLASLTVIAALKDKAPEMIKIDFDLSTGEVKMEWLDTYDEQGRMKGCSSDPFDETIKSVDAIFKEGLEGIQQAYNQPPPPPATTTTLDPKAVQKKAPQPILGPGVVQKPTTLTVAPKKKMLI